MSSRHPRSSRATSWLALAVSALLILSCLMQPMVSIARERRLLVSHQGKQQKREPAGNGKEKRVPPVPPQPGAPPFILPDLQTESRRQRPAPVAPPAVASTIRSKRKPLESREGRKVGDRLRPRGRSHHARQIRRVLSGSSRSRVLAPAPGMVSLVFTEDPLIDGIPIRAVHITELRQKINDARTVANLPAASWAEPIIAGQTFAKASHITEMRLRLDEARLALGLSTGGYTDPGLTSGYDIKAVHIQQLRTKVREILDPSSSDVFVLNFLQWGLGRAPNGDESSYWADIMRAAHPQGQASRLMAGYELGMTVFDSAEYAGRNRTNQQYVSDLYHAYLMRAPETCDPNDPNYSLCGPVYWANACNTNGRAAVRQAFDESIEFHNLVAAMTISGVPSGNAASLATARVDLFNQSGNQTRARDCEWSLPLVSLPGRAGLDLGVSLSYSSLVWIHSGPYVYFDPDNESLSPGFTIGFPSVQWRSFDAQTARNVYLLTAAGRRTELRQVGTSNVYESADSSYLQLIDYGSSLLLRTTDGAQMSYSNYANGWQVTEIKDRNGNLILVNNDWRGDIQNIIDTLGRVIDFHYDGNANLNSITQTWNGVEHPWATFGWGSHSMANNLSSQVIGTYNGETNPVLTQVGLDDGSRYNFEYTGNGQVSVIRRYTANLQRAYTAYDYQGTADCPRIYQARVSAENWTSVNGVPGEVVTSFNDNGDNTHTMTAPDGTTYKEFYGGTGGSPLWQKGLVIQTEVSSGIRQKWTTTGYSQDNTSVSYQTNPRVTETNIYDAGNNRRRTTIDYSPAAYVQFGLPYFISEYAANGTTEIRRTYTDYNLSQAYLNRRIIGLVSQRRLYDPAVGWQSKTTYGYDSGAINWQATSAPGHDQSYDASFTARGNLTSVSRWDATDIENASKALTSQMSYDAAGNVVTSRDAANHQSLIGYSDSFPGTYGGTNTFAYPTTVTDADGNSSYVQYNYYFGGRTQVLGPPPANQSSGIVQTFTYDEARRLKRATVTNTGAYSHYEYGPNYTQVYSSVNTVSTDPLASDSYSVQLFDGVGRVFAAAGNHPGSSGGYKAQWTQFDAMGRAMKQSNPTEVTGGWAPAGDDVAGVVYTQQTYDWQGRPLETRHLADGTVKYAEYSGCGCAGGEMVTLTDEVGRQQKVYSDVLGRQWKTEVLDEAGNVYSSIATIYNARDQVMAVNSYKGTATSDLSCPSGTCMQLVTGYDGYGRVASRKLPQQTAVTSYEYYADDTVQTITDPRGVVATNSYNNRHLLTGISYSVGLAPVSYGYDAAGNRTSMSDGTGSVTYAYDQLSRMSSEIHNLSGLGAYQLLYGYNFANELTNITDPNGAQVSYSYDSTGRLTAMPASGYTGVTNFLSNAQYRASGGLKHATYGNSVQIDLSYNSRMQIGQYQVTGFQSPYGNMGASMSYQEDGRTSTAFDLNDSRFDRKYEFDFAARLKESYTGVEAHGAPPPPLNQANSPYRQTYTYDQWNNVTERTGRIWAQNDSEGASYGSDNKRSWFGYDSAGNVTTASGDGTRTYDAAGRPVTFTSEQQWQVYPNWASGHPNAPALETEDTFDGAGQVIRHINHTRHDDTYDLGGGNLVYNMTDTTKTTYYVRSTVLSGKTIVELNQSGVKTKGYVYSGGGRIATQTIVGASNSVEIESTNPVTGAAVLTDANGSYATRQEPDPLGRDLTTVPDPTIAVDPVASSKWNEPMPIEYAGGPTAEYQQANANWAQDMVLRSLGIALTNHFKATTHLILEKNPNIGIRTNVGNSLYGNDASNYLDSLHGEYLGGNTLMAEDASIRETQPQKTDFNAGKAWAFNDDQKKILSQVHNRISDQDCKDFINKILADNHVAKDRNTFDKLLSKADFNTYNEDSTDLGVDTDGLLFLRNAFNNDGAPAATYGNHIFFVKTAFLRATFNSLPALGLHNRNIDTATIVVHELLHVAGLNDPQVQNLNRQIHEHCGFTGMDY